MTNTNKLVAELIGTFTLVASVLGAALVSFGGAKVLHDVTGFLERELRTTI